MQKTVHILILISIILGLQGCLYSNKCGMSTNYYDKKQSYYDSQGNYREECPESNVIDYSDVGL